MGIYVDTIRKWRRRWRVDPQLAALSDAPRSGQPRTFTAMQAARVKAMARAPPEQAGAPLSR